MHVFVWSSKGKSCKRKEGKSEGGKKVDIVMYVSYALSNSAGELDEVRHSKTGFREDRAVEVTLI